MLKIDDNLLQTIGLGSLPVEDKRGLLTHIYETLEMRVGMRLADQMSNEQLDEFETYFEAKDDAGAFKWLETNFPNYKDIVNEEFEKLKTEVQTHAPEILAAAQANPAQAAAPAPVAPAMPAAPAVDPAQAPQWQQPNVAAPVDPYAQPTPQPYQAPAPAPTPVVPTEPAAPMADPYASPAPQPPVPPTPAPQPSQPVVQPWTPDQTPSPAPAPADPQMQPYQPAPTQPPAPQQFQPMPPAWNPDQSQQQ